MIQSTNFDSFVGRTASASCSSSSSVRSVYDESGDRRWNGTVDTRQIDGIRPARVARRGAYFDAHALGSYPETRTAWVVAVVVVAGGLVRARDPCASCALEISRVETRFADAVPPHISAFLSSQLLALARLPLAPPPRALPLPPCSSSSPAVA